MEKRIFFVATFIAIVLGGCSSQTYREVASVSREKSTVVLEVQRIPLRVHKEVRYPKYGALKKIGELARKLLSLKVL